MSTCSAQYPSPARANRSCMARSESSAARAVTTFPTRAAPSARAKYVSASANGNAVRRGSSAAAAAHAPRSSAHRAGIAASANTPADPGAAEATTFGSNRAAIAGRPSRMAFAARSCPVCR